MAIDGWHSLFWQLITYAYTYVVVYVRGEWRSKKVSGLLTILPIILPNKRNIWERRSKDSNDIHDISILII